MLYYSHIFIYMMMRDYCGRMVQPKSNPRYFLKIVSSGRTDIA